MEAEHVSDHTAEIADKVRTGEYFREARQMYDLSVHDPMAERYFYVAITVLAGLILLVAVSAMNGLYPLKTPVPFIYNINDVVDDLPHMKSLVSKKGEDPGFALLRFLTNNYVTMREEYNIETFDRSITGIKSQSSDAVFADFQKFVDPRNAESPITQYQRYSTRSISIVSTRPSPGNDRELEVIFNATVEGRGEVKKSQWQANIAFQYSGLALDQESEKPKPISFVVTQYRTKRLQDIK